MREERRAVDIVVPVDRVRAPDDRHLDRHVGRHGRAGRIRPTASASPRHWHACSCPARRRRHSGSNRCSSGEPRPDVTERMSGWVICPTFCSSVIPATIDRTRASSCASGDVAGAAALGHGAWTAWHEARSPTERQSRSFVRIRRALVNAVIRTCCLEVCQRLPALWRRWRRRRWRRRHRAGVRRQDHRSVRASLRRRRRRRRRWRRRKWRRWRRRRLLPEVVTAAEQERPTVFLIRLQRLHVR